MSVFDEEIQRKVTQWLTYGDEDLRLARHGLTLTTDQPFRLIAYHAQQCAEKYLKGYLVFHKIDFPYTHNIARLVELCSDQGLECEVLRDAEELTPFAITARYPGEDEDVTEEEALRAIAIAAQVCEIVSEGLGQRKGRLPMTTIRFGSNTFSADKSFTIVGADDSGNLIIGGFGRPPKTQLVWVEFKQDGAFLNADLADADGDRVLQIKDNIITYNKDNIYRVEQYPENQIPPDRVVVLNQYGEMALDLRREGGTWDFNGDFYHGSSHIVATPQGTVINPTTPHV